MIIHHAGNKFVMTYNSSGESRGNPFEIQEASTTFSGGCIKVRR